MAGTTYSPTAGFVRSVHSIARHKGAVGVAVFGALLLVQPISAASAYPNPTPIGLASAGSFTVLAAATVTNTGNTVVSADAGVGGNLGVSPGTAVTGFPPGVVQPPGAINPPTPSAAQAHTDSGNAYTTAQGLTPNKTFAPVWDLGGQTFTAGIYNDPSSLAITGSVTLDGGGDPNSVFIFQAGSSLVTAASSSVTLIGSAQACNVFWAVGSSATLGATSTFNGTILANTSISMGNAAQIQGRLLAGAEDITGAVTLDTDAIHTPACASSVGVAQAPLFGRLGSAVAVIAFLGGAGVLVVRRRLHTAPIR